MYGPRCCFGRSRNRRRHRCHPRAVVLGDPAPPLDRSHPDQCTSDPLDLSRHVNPPSGPQHEAQLRVDSLDQLDLPKGAGLARVVASVSLGIGEQGAIASEADRSGSEAQDAILGSPLELLQPAARFELLNGNRSGCHGRTKRVDERNRQQGFAVRSADHKATGRRIHRGLLRCNDCRTSRFVFRSTEWTESLRPRGPHGFGRRGSANE